MPSFETALWITLGSFCIVPWVLIASYQRFQRWRYFRRQRQEIARAARFRNRLYVADLQRAHLNAVVGQRRH